MYPAKLLSWKVHEVALEMAVQLPAAPELEGGVELLESLDSLLEPEVVVQPGPLRSEEDGEVLQQRAAGAVVGEAVERVAVDHAAPKPVHEPRLGVEPVAQSLQQIVEAPAAPGAVVLRLPDRRPNRCPPASLVHDAPYWNWA